jgi:hypothetical protein
MLVTELSREQLTELKQKYLTDMLMITYHESPSYDELANVDNMIPDNLIFAEYVDIDFSNDDFLSSCA